MKFQILNNEELGFFDDNGNKTATIKISGSNDLVINPSGSGDIILGDDDNVNDIEIGTSSTPSNFIYLGGLPTTDPQVIGQLFQTGSDAIGATAGFQVVLISQG